ncbi:hypothetical protein ACIGKL_07075 [Pseudomonas sp. NPDC077186]|uniref:hypothetical protein n=1 Tax=Pseudomonas sp. NPDC077186 TaxID=3364421 RepID=UPI0037C52B2E
MKRLHAHLLFLLTLLLSEPGHSEEGTIIASPLEFVEVTIRMSGDHPYGELRMCEECPMRLLPFAPGALVYINGQRITADRLQDGQSLEGTVFLRNKPIDSINEIIAK